jgi:ribonuclease P protein component
LQTGEEKGEKDFQPDISAGGRNLPFATLKKRNEFEKLRKKGRLFKNRHLVLYVLPQEEGNQLRAGFAINKKTGKAFQRNKIRRVLKEILRKVQIPYSIDVFIIARHTINEAGFEELKNQMENSLRQFFQSER